MADRITVMSWLEGLADSDWRMFHSDSEVQNIAQEALKLLKEQNKKQIKIHKRHVITLKRHDEFSMRKLYESICETLLDEGNLKIVRTDDHEKVEFVWEIAQEEDT